MKKITLLLFIMCVFGYAQNTVTVEVGSSPGNYLGYNNVFENPADPAPCCGGGYIYGEAFGVADLVTEINASNITLKPNVIYYNATDGFWANTWDDGLDGNKIVEANTFIEPGGTFNNVDLTFTADVTSNTLSNPRYTVQAFIKTVGTGGGFSRFVDLTGTTGVFSVTATGLELATGTIQFGIAITGLNANPADDWGSVVVEPVTLSTNDFELSQVKAFPNPTNNVWNINTNNQNIQSIAVYDVLGKQVFTSNPNTSEAIIDSNNFSNGLYFAKVKTINGESNLRLVKN